MSTLHTRLRGTGVALVTPFASDGSIDMAGLGRLIDHCIVGGVEHLVALGTTGESATLSRQERHAVLDYVVKHTAGRVPVIAGFGGNHTQGVIDDITAYHMEGIDAILSASPYYNKPTQAGIIAHFTAIADAAPRPVILYNVPSRTGSNMTAETTISLSHHANIIGIKEASGLMGQCMQIVIHTAIDFLKLSGDDNITLPLIALGFDGVISVSGQGMPRMFSDMVRAALAGDYTRARSLHYPLVDVTDMLFAEGNPGGIKHLLSQLGVCGAHMRLPLVPISLALQSKIQAELDTLSKLM
jgi:4-hydroxy-tetrahydrodipicolinate synthase